MYYKAIIVNRVEVPSSSEALIQQHHVISHPSEFQGGADASKRLKREYLNLSNREKEKNEGDWPELEKAVWMVSSIKKRLA